MESPCIDASSPSMILPPMNTRVRTGARRKTPLDALCCPEALLGPGGSRSIMAGRWSRTCAIRRLGNGRDCAQPPIDGRRPCFGRLRISNTPGDTPGHDEAGSDGKILGMRVQHDERAGRLLRMQLVLVRNRNADPLGAQKTQD